MTVNTAWQYIAKLSGDCLFLVFLERSHENCFVLRGLETAMTKLGRGVDEFQLDIFQRLPLGVRQKWLKFKSIKLFLSRYKIFSLYSTPMTHPTPYQKSFPNNRVFQLAVLFNIIHFRRKMVIRTIIIKHLNKSTLFYINPFTFLRVRTRFLGPMQHPLIMTKSCLTSP